jgi:hypothetical protein
MKAIQPVSIWKDGQLKTATLLNIVCNDNLKDGAVFAYSLLSETVVDPEELPLTEQLSDGVIGLGGTEYENWDDSNDQAYSIVAAKLNITLL